MTDFVAFINAASAFFQATCWPLLVLIIVLIFKQPFEKFVSNLGEFSLKAGASGLEASAKKSEAVANLGAATVKSNEQGPLDPDRIIRAAKTVDALSDRQILKLTGKQLLWVDDNPANNLFERRALEALGIRIEISLDTEEALELIHRKHFDVIVSDFARLNDNRAGYTLLGQLKQQANNVPYIIYSAHTTRENRREASHLGAFGRTNVPEELFQLVLNALLSINYTEINVK